MKNALLTFLVRPVFLFFDIQADSLVTVMTPDVVPVTLSHRMGENVSYRKGLSSRHGRGATLINTQMILSWVWTFFTFFFCISVGLVLALESSLKLIF